MATKWKNKCKVKYFLWALLCVIPAMMILSAYPHIRQQGEKEGQKYYTTQEFAEYLLNGNQTLYEEIYEKKIRELYPPSNSFMEIRPYLQYEVVNKHGKTIANNGESLEQVLKKEQFKAYDWIVAIEYDHLGNAEVKECYGTYAQKMKVRLTYAMNPEKYEDSENIETAEELGTPIDCTFLYGMTKEQGKAYQEFVGNPYYMVYYVNGMAVVPQILTLVLIGAAMLLPFIKKLDTGKEKYFQIPVEGILIVVVGLLLLWEGATSLTIHTIGGEVQRKFVQFGLSNGEAEDLAMGWNLIVWMFYFGMVYWAAGNVRSLFGSGWKTVIGERIFLIPFFRKHREKLEKGCSFLKEKYRRLSNRVEKFFRIDLQEHSNKMLFRFVAVQFVIVSLFCMGWFYGIAGTLIYSIILFRILRKKYREIRQDYEKMLQATERIAAGNLDISMEQDFGIFDPIRQQLLQIQSGFKTAVEEEVKSQKMKTELITNVSHDLKTPLTAIITYVNLLKEEGITDAERTSYIDVLERKSMRLKVLIEDLFEVSKASSKNVKLELAKVDIISLLKQVRLELSGRMEQSGLDFRWKFPEEKVYLMLDGQKTYRIFENLIVNILKYSLEGTRVYIDVTDTGELVTITMKNISKGELNLEPGELTERFVRGDVSRNTEGSGLGLAIVKSFVELQKGHLKITVNGDMFIAEIQWKRTDMEELI